MSDTLPKTYTYQYRMISRFGRWMHQWELVGALGGVHLSITEYESNGRVEHSAGLETHFRRPPDYMEDRPPSFNHCFLLEAPCWHDGTSTYAHERYLPQFLAKHSHEDIFRSLVVDANRYLRNED